MKLSLCIISSCHFPLTAILGVWQGFFYSQPILLNKVKSEYIFSGTGKQRSFSLYEDNFQMKILSQPAPGHWYKTISREFERILFLFIAVQDILQGIVVILCFCLCFFFPLLLFENVNADQCLLCTLENPSHLQKEKYLCHLKCR